MGVCTTHKINREGRRCEIQFVLYEYIHKQMEHVIASYLRQIWIRMIGYTRDNMDLGRDIRAKVK